MTRYSYLGEPFIYAARFDTINLGNIVGLRRHSPDQAWRQIGFLLECPNTDRGLESRFDGHLNVHQNDLRQSLPVDVYGNLSVLSLKALNLHLSQFATEQFAIYEIILRHEDCAKKENVGQEDLVTRVSTNSPLRS